MADTTILPRHERYGDPTADIAHKKGVRRSLAAFAAGGGASGWVVEFTLSAGAGATSTTVPATGVSATCQISLSPVTAEAASLLGKTWVSGLVSNTDMAVGTFTVSHPAVLAGVTATYRASIKG